ALAAAFAGRTRPLRVGAVKTNIGHTEAASGVAGLIKTVLALGADRIPPNLHFGRRNPAISTGATPIEVPTAAVSGIRRAGVSAFGFSGTNAHVVVEAAPATPPAAATGDGVLFLSATDPHALRALTARYAEAFANGLDFVSACHTAAVGRAKFPWWIAVRTPAELLTAEPSNAAPPKLGASTGQRVTLPTYPFQRERFPLPGGASQDHVLAPDDPLLAGTDGLAHLGVLLALLGDASALEEVAFPAPLAVGTPRHVRAVRDAGRISLESRTDADGEWTVHLKAIACEPATQTIRSALPTPNTPATELYDRIAAHGFFYGEAARCLDKIAVAGDVATGTLKPGDGPGVIEAAAQLAYSLLPEGAPPVMLASARRLTRMTGTAATVWFRRTGTTTDGSLSADLGMSDADGRDLLLIEGATFAPLPNAARRWSRIVTWREMPLPVSSQPAPAPIVWQAPKGTASEVCAALLDRLGAMGAGHLRIVTRGAQVTGDEAAAPDLGQAALWGMAQAIIGERPALRCRLIDLDPDLPAEAQQAMLAAEILADDEPAVALRGHRRLVRRLDAPSPILPGQDVAVLAKAGTVVWDKRAAVAPGPGMVRIEVTAAGLTFRDRLLFNGMAPQASGLGCDCAGVVAEVGAGVTAFAVGDRVIALADQPIADSVTVSVDSVAPAPCADLLDAATMPVPYLTALAGLGTLGPKDRVLIHQAASATGLAALAVARRAGARVIATASRKRHSYFPKDDVERVLDSRDPAGWAGALTGVTVAFGSFDPPALAQLGGIRVVNLGKHAAEPFDLDKIPTGDKRRLMGELAAFPPLPRRIVPRDALGEALAGEGPLAGRTVIQMREPPPAIVERGATYIVTGAAGALGGMVAAWLRQSGAIVCHVDRRAVDVALPHFSVAADAGDAAAMTALFDRIGASGSVLRGIFHCAAIVDDDRLEQQSAERLTPVLAAKVDGALVLDHLTRERCVGTARLDHFVLFASIVGVVPSARQAGYAAANAVLDQLAHARRRHGLPGLSLDWGPWNAGIGRAMGVRAAEAWQGHGITPILPAMGLRALPSLLAVPEAQRVVADMAWERTQAGPSEPSVQSAPAPANAGPPTVERLQAILARLLGVREPSSLDPDTPLMTFGLDSLIAVEFARALSREYGRPVAPDFAYSHPTLADAMAGLATRRQAAAKPAAFSLLMPRWTGLASAPVASAGWTVAGDGSLAQSLRATLPADSTNLVDLSALDVDAAGDIQARAALFPALLERLRARGGTGARIVLVAPAEGPLAGAVEGFATGLAAEFPAWRVRSVRLDTSLADAAVALTRELAIDDGEARVSVGRQGREGVRLVAAGGGAPWRADPDATYLVTGGSGGIGALVAAHLVSLGARHLALASRSPSVPAPLAAGPAQIALHPTDFDRPEQIARLMTDLRSKGRRLAGIFHVAGVTANGAVNDSDWTKIGRSFPAKADAAALLDVLSRDMNVADFVLFSSATAWFGLARTSGYAAANGFLDGVIERRRAAGLPGQSIAWCAWQGVGMAADPLMWQDGRVPSLSPQGAMSALDAALASGEALTVVIERGWQSTSTSRLLERPGLAVSGERV
ncbi:MAG: SDR family NAD(P)-dependent oxidoreductase, partial [Proteobacteria bacterium]|nr:SDR family NAD(P)-dependent oxidoreductase [Pseudomonadota bacterium]